MIPAFLKFFYALERIKLYNKTALKSVIRFSILQWNVQNNVVLKILIITCIIRESYNSFKCRCNITY